MRHGLGYIAAVALAVVATAFICGWRGSTDRKTYDPILGCETTAGAPDPLAALRISVDFRGEPLDRAVDVIARLIGRPIDADYEALNRIGVGRQHEVWLTARDAPASVVLDLLVDDASESIAFVDRSGDPVRIRVRDDSPLPGVYAREYDVRRLVAAAVDRQKRRRPFEGNWLTDQLGFTHRYNGGQQGLFEDTGEDEELVVSELINAAIMLIYDTVSPDEWRQNGGLSFSVAEYQGVLIVNANADAHRQIVALLHAVYAAQHDQPPDPADLDAYRRTVRRLAQPLDIELAGQPLRTLLDHLHRTSPLSINLPLDGALGLGPNAVVEGRTNGRPIGDVLGEVIDAELGWGHAHDLMRRATRADGIIAMSGARDGWAAPIVRVYPIGALVESDGRRLEDAGTSVSERIEYLMTTLRDTVEPDNWRNAGGLHASMQAFDTALVISAPPMMHDQLEHRLADLTRLRTRYAGR